MTIKTDIRDMNDIKSLVNAFYQKVQSDELLSPIFFGRIKDDWQPHLETMYLFWNAALFGQKGYTGNPFSKHALLDIHEDHFNRWLSLFEITIDSLFTGPLATDAKWRASVMAENFNKRLQMNRGQNNINIV